MKPLGWSKQVRARRVWGTREAVALGLSHLVVQLDDGTRRARCGVRCDTTPPYTDMPEVDDPQDICLRCRAPYPKQPRTGTLTPLKRRKPKDTP